jgi:dihydrolipoamide dehydrogenase
MFDVLIIGSGPGGYIAAVRAAQFGMKTAIVEREHLGGTCLNWGCIPTKALLRSADMVRNLGHFEDFGLSLEGTVSVDVAKVVARSRSVSSRLNAGVGFLMKKNNVDVIWGEARIEQAPKDGGPAVVRVTASTKPPMQPQHPVP